MFKKIEVYRKTLAISHKTPYLNKSAISPPHLLYPYRQNLPEDITPTQNAKHQKTAQAKRLQNSPCPSQSLEKTANQSHQTRPKIASPPTQILSNASPLPLFPKMNLKTESLNHILILSFSQKKCSSQAVIKTKVSLAELQKILNSSHQAQSQNPLKIISKITRPISKNKPISLKTMI